MSDTPLSEADAARLAGIIRNAKGEDR
jgi:hypothetical protein